MLIDAKGGMLRIFLVAVAVKILLIPAYHSTDFEVHRNWMAITHTLGVEKWYTEDTSIWTLDYPPLFAWLEFVLAKVATLIEPQMLEVLQSAYISPVTLLYQRLTVIALDLVLVSAAYRAFHRLPFERALALFALVVGNVGLIIVDNIHFQYNGMLIGLLMWSALSIEDGHDILGGIIFTILINMKHLFIFAGPVFFVYLLRHFCWGHGFHWKLFKLGSSVISVFFISFGPFIWLGQIAQVLRRLFPFGRGLLHAYWAPNAWSLYSLLDKTLSVAFRQLGFHVGLEANLTGGLVQETKFTVLPQISPLLSFLLTMLSMSPCLVLLWKKPHPKYFMESIAYANLCAFVWGYHVHEKAILTVILPLLFSAAQPHLLFSLQQDIVHFSTLCIYSLFPLIFSPQEYPIKICLIIINALIVCIAVPGQRNWASGSRSKKWQHRVCFVHLWGLLGVEMYSAFIHSWLWQDKLPFLPLLLTSVYCAVGIFCYWGKWCLEIVQQGLAMQLFESVNRHGSE